MEHIVIDEGYLSRIIHKFTRQDLIRKAPSPKDKRRHVIQLTEKGKKEFSKLNENSDKLISELIEKLSDQEVEDVTRMMGRIYELLDKD